MRNQDSWKPSKYVQKRGRLRATTDTGELMVGSRLMADRIAQAYDGACKVHAAGRLLDMGCGKAPLFASYGPHVDEVQCVDWGQSLHGSTYIDHECDLTKPLPYPDGRFETIVLSDVLEHLPEPMTCWREMNRLLVTGGKVLLNVPFYYPIHEAPHDFYRYTEFALSRFAEMTGFEVVELRPIGGPLDIFADMAGKLAASARMKPVAAAIHSVASSRIGARLSARGSKRFPLGYFMVVAKRSGGD
jgi:SAM-dependent methyltransferase